MKTSWRVILFLLLFFVATVLSVQAQPAPSQTVALIPYTSPLDRLRARALPITPLARLNLAGTSWLVAGMSAMAADAYTASGGRMQGLDPAPDAGPLYLVETPPPLSLDDLQIQLEQYGHVLWQAHPYALLQTSPPQARALSRQGVRLVLLDKPISLATRPATFDPPPSAPDPTIAEQVALFLPAAIQTWDQRLSGVDEVTIGGNPRHLRSRYSWSSNGRRSEQYVYEQLQAMGYSPSYYPYTTPHGDLGWRNIIVDIPGQVDPERLILVVGHLDSISYPLGDAPANAPGADDNATGSSAMLAMAELLKDEQLYYTLRFVWFTGEEFGYWGSIPYVQALAAQNANVVAAIDIDMIGYDGNSDKVMEIHEGTETNNQQLADYLVAMNNLYGLGLTIERKTTSASRFSDHRNFWDNGYPSLLLIENFFDGSAEDPIPKDRNPNYHTTDDTSSYVDFSYATAIARMAMAAALHLAVPYNGEPIPTPTPTATATHTPTPTPTPTPLPSACVQLLENGGFETDAGWSFGATARKAGYSTALPHSGARSLRTGIPPSTSNKYAYSTAYQGLTLPAEASKLTLQFWVNAGGADANDRSEVLLFKPNWSLLKVVWRDRPNDETWTAHTYDLSTYAGQDIYLYFNTLNDGSGASAWAYFDDVSLLACYPVTSTPTPTPTATVTSSATATATPTTTLTHAPTSSPTSTPTPTPTLTPSPSPTFPPSSTPTTIPSPTATATATLTTTATPTPTLTPTTTPTLTLTPTAIPSPTATPTPPSTPTATVTPFPSPSPTPTLHPRPTKTPTIPPVPLARRLYLPILLRGH